MYKLLLATDKKNIQEMFDQIDAWESLGFRSPRRAESAQSAIECLKAHRVDAIAYDLPAEDAAVLFEYLQQNHPILPIFSIATDVAAQLENINELRVLIGRTHADFSNDNFGEADMMQLCRHEFLRALLSEQISSETEVVKRFKLLRSKMDPSKPCVVLDMELPQGEEYLAGQWHYGPERLEIGLRNFFGTEYEGMKMVVAVITPHYFRLLACPMLGVDAVNSDESMTGLVVSHADDAIAHVREYLGLDVQIVNIHVMSSVTKLAHVQ